MRRPVTFSTPGSSVAAGGSGSGSTVRRAVVVLLLLSCAAVDPAAGSNGAQELLRTCKQDWATLSRAQQEHCHMLASATLEQRRGAAERQREQKDEHEVMILASKADARSLQQMQQLLEAGTAPDAARGGSNWGALFIAVHARKHKVAELLLKHGSDPAQVDSSGASLLMTAAYVNDLKVATMLLEAG